MTPDQNRRQYDRHARAYHEKRSDAARSYYNDHLEWPMMLKLLRGRVRGRHVLELGCGTGLLTRKLVRMGGRVTGVDSSGSMIEIAREEVRGATFVRADMRRIRAGAGGYDLVVSSLAFHYVRELGDLLARCHKMLRPDGLLIFSIHHPNSSLKLLQDQKKSGGVYFSVGAPYRWRMLPGMELVSYHQTIESISDGLVSAGFLVERILESKPRRASRHINPKAYDAAQMIPPFLAVCARKEKKD